MIRATAAILIALGIAACTPAASRGVPPEVSGATLLVENRSTLEMTIYALRGSQRVRLGQASAVRETALAIPRELVSGTGLRFIADPIGASRTPISQEITVWPGDTIQMQIPYR